MFSIEKIDTGKKADVKRFVRLPYRLYKGHSEWVPPLYIDQEMFLNRDKHPYYEHSDADFFVAVRNGVVIGRIAVLENKNYNQFRNTNIAQFYLFECEDDQEAAAALFNRAYEWAQERPRYSGFPYCAGWPLPCPQRRCRQC